MGDSPAPSTPTRVEWSTTAFVVVCAAVLGAFAAVEVIAGPGASRPAAAGALVASFAAAVVGGVAVWAARTGPGVARLRTVRDGTAACLTGATVALVVRPTAPTPLLISAGLLTVVGLGLLAVAFPPVRARVGLAVE